MAEADKDSQMEFMTSASPRVSTRTSQVGPARVFSMGRPINSRTIAVEASIHPWNMRSGRAGMKPRPPRLVVSGMGYSETVARGFRDSGSLPMPSAVVRTGTNGGWPISLRIFSPPSGSNR